MDEPPGLGPARARNDGAQQATGDILVFVDSDIEVHPEVFTRIRARFSSDPELVALFGSYDDDPQAPGVVSIFRNLLHHHVHQASPGPAATFWAGLGAVRRDAFLAVGGFDAERFAVPSVEDIDLGMRLARAGGKIVLDPQILGKHLKSWTLRDMVRTDFARRGVPWVRLLLEDRGNTSRGALNLGWRHRASAAACLVGVAGVALRRPALAIGATSALIALNRTFYALLARRGPSIAVAGIGLHAVHHLTAVAAVPTGVVTYLLDRSDTRQAR